MITFHQSLSLDNSKWAGVFPPIEYEVKSEYSTLVTLTKEDLILFKSAICSAQQIGIFLAEDNMIAFELCANLQKWKEELNAATMEVLFSDKELAIIDVALSFISLQMAMQGNRLKILNT